MSTPTNSAATRWGTSMGDPEERPAILPPIDPEERPAILPPIDPSQIQQTGGAGAGAVRSASADSVTDGPRAHEFPTAETQHSGFIIIRLRDAHALATAEDIQQLIQNAVRHNLEKQQLAGRRLTLGGADQLELSSVAALLSSEIGNLQPLVATPGFPYEGLRELEDRASRTPLRPLHSLAAYRRVDARYLASEEAERVVSLLNDLPWVDLAYRELAANDPQPVESQGTDPLAQHQHYLERAPIGISARRAWPLMNGHRVQAIDLEQGWISHNELWPDEDPELLHGDNRHRKSPGTDTYRGNHGTAVVGQLVADHDRDGGAGVAPGSRVFLLSHFLQASGSNGHVASAIVAAVHEVVHGKTLQPGDVLLVEVQRGFLPAEVDPADFDAIRLAAAHGLIVIEAAGNGGFALDAYRDAAGRAVLDRRGTSFRDSGAIVVGASRSRYPNDRASFSNFGSRVDCFACGEGVVTTGYGDLDHRDRHHHTQTFGGTSSAAPIVAGAALILQSLHESRAGQRLSPSQMRSILSEPATGTPQGRGVAGHIGVMPNLDAICESLALVPQVYLREHAGDLGGERSGNMTCSCPDIRVDDELITLQMHNRGLQTAAVKATVYCTELATLVLPKEEDLFGTFADQGQDEVVSISVQPGNLPQTAEVNQADPERQFPQPASFLTMLDYGQEPKPTLLPDRPYFRWRDFLSFNRQHAKRSVVEAEDLNGAFPFLIVGAPDHPRSFDFEILQNFPSTARVGLQVPLHLAARFWSDRLPPEGGLEDKDVLLLPRTPRLFFPQIVLDSERPYSAAFHIRRVCETGSTLVIRQLFEGEEVGRITWNF